MNRARLNLVLGVMVLGLGVAAWMAVQHKNQPKAALTALAVEGIDRVLIEWPGSEAIRLEKRQGEWQLTAPVQARADRFEAVGATSLASTEVQETVDLDGLDLAELGLSPPNHSVTLNEVKVEFGGTEPLLSRRYVRVGEAIYLINDPATAALDKDYSDLVSKELFAANDAPVKIELPDFTLSKASDGSWSAPPGTPNATPASLKTLADGWIEARSMWNEAAPGEAPKGDLVRVTTASGQAFEFVAAAVEPQLALYSPALKMRYQLSKALADTLFKLPDPMPAEADKATPDQSGQPTPEH